jgi:hypothetical protein
LGQAIKNPFFFPFKVTPGFFNMPEFEKARTLKS